jgi:hypothetical protein
MLCIVQFSVFIYTLFNDPFGCSDYIAPNVVVEWLTLLLHIRKDPDSNIGPETGNLD